MPTRYPILQTTVALLRAIRTAPRTRAELAEALGVSEITIRRVIDGLRAAGVQIDERRRGHDRSPLEYSTHARI